MTPAALINLNPDKYTQGLHYCPFAFNLDRCVRSCNTLNVPNREDLSVSIFNMITGINYLKT